MVARPREETAEQRDVLHLVVIGTPRRMIGAKLSMAERTVDLRIREVKRALGCRERFALGMQAVRVGIVNAGQPVAAALPRRIGDQWTAPNEQQQRILDLLATDAPVIEIGPELSLSTRTVRAAMANLRHSNGAADLTHLGALSEALGWYCLW